MIDSIEWRETREERERGEKGGEERGGRGEERGGRGERRAGEEERKEGGESWRKRKREGRRRHKLLNRCLHVRACTCTVHVVATCTVQKCLDNLLFNLCI